MKKLITSAIIPFFILLFTTGCKKDVAATKETDLSATTWVSKLSEAGVDISETLAFTTTSSVNYKLIITGPSGVNISSSGTYIYTIPNIEININGTIKKGTIEGNKLYSTSSTGNPVVFVKQ